MYSILIWLVLEIRDRIKGEEESMSLGEISAFLAVVALILALIRNERRNTGWITVKEQKNND